MYSQHVRLLAQRWARTDGIAHDMLQIGSELVGVQVVDPAMILRRTVLFNERLLSSRSNEAVHRVSTLSSSDVSITALYCG